MKGLPFLTLPKEKQIAEIGDEGTGVVHLLKRSGVTPKENPADMQERQKKTAKVQALLIKATQRLAKNENISRTEARKRLFATPTKSAENGEQVEEEGAGLYDHLEPEEVEMFLQLQIETQELRIRAATLMIQFRIAFPVEVVALAKAGSEALEVKPIGFGIPAGDRILFGDIVVEVSDYADEGSLTIQVEKLKAPIRPETVGYLCFKDASTAKIGDPNWTQPDTESLLLESQVQLLYDFYRMEAAGLDSIEELYAEEDNELGSGEDSSATLSDSSSSRLLTGEISISDSNGLDVERSGSTPETLEISPVG